MKNGNVGEVKSSVFEDANILFRNEDYDGVVKLLNGYLNQNNEDITALHLLGTSYAKLGQYAKAESAFHRELKIDPSQADAYFNLGLIYAQQQIADLAIDNFRKAIEYRPNDVQAMNDIGVIYYNQGEVEKAKEFFTQALKNNPSYKEAFLNIFELLWNEGKYSTALEHAYDFLNSLSQKTPGIKLEKEATESKVPEVQPSSKKKKKVAATTSKVEA